MDANDPRFIRMRIAAGVIAVIGAGCFMIGAGIAEDGFNSGTMRTAALISVLVIGTLAVAVPGYSTFGAALSSD